MAEDLAPPVYLPSASGPDLIATLALGTGIGGVSRWVNIFGLQFQFSEIAKILMAVVLANYLASRQDKLGKLWTIIGAGIIAAPPLVLVLIQPDLGTSWSSAPSSSARCSWAERACAGWASASG